MFPTLLQVTKLRAKRVDLVQPSSSQERTYTLILLKFYPVSCSVTSPLLHIGNSNIFYRYFIYYLQLNGTWKIMKQ